MCIRDRDRIPFIKHLGAFVFCTDFGGRSVFWLALQPSRENKTTHKAFSDGIGLFYHSLSAIFSAGSDQPAVSQRLPGVYRPCLHGVGVTLVASQTDSVCYFQYLPDFVYGGEYKRAERYQDGQPDRPYNTGKHGYCVERRGPKPAQRTIIGCLLYTSS